MTIRVFVQNEAGSALKNYHDEKTLAFRHSRQISHAYPFPYGFIIGTDADDDCNVDCFVITDRPLRTGEIVECEPIGLMEQFEDDVTDHNVLARPVGETQRITAAIEVALIEHVLACFRHVAGKKMSVGDFRSALDAEAHVAAHLEGAPRNRQERG